MNTKKIKIYVESATGRAAGYKGQWFELPKSISVIKSLVQLKDNDEYIISDYEAPFKIREHAKIEVLNDMAKKMEDIPESLLKASNILIGDLFDSFEQLIDEYDSVIVVSAKNNEDVGHYLKDEGIVSVPEHLRFYVDFDAMGRDFIINSGGVMTDYGFFYK